MAVHSCGKVCVISEIEYELWINHEIEPNCKDHQHIKTSKAFELADPKSIVFNGHGPAAKWVGPKHIIRDTARKYRKIYVCASCGKQTSKFGCPCGGVGYGVWQYC